MMKYQWHEVSLPWPVAFLCALLLAACSPDRYDIEAFEPSLVVNGMATAGEGAWAEISMSVAPTTEGVTEIDSLWVRDAEVWLVQWPSGSRHLLHYTGAGRYELADTAVEAGSHYRLEVSAPGFPSAYSSPVQVPDAPLLVDTVAFSSRPDLALNAANGASAILADFTLRDMQDSTAYYMLEMRHLVSGQALDDMWNIQSMWNITEPEGWACQVNHSSFTNLCFRGSTRQIMFLREHSQGAGGRMILEISRIDRLFYEYLQYEDSEGFDVGLIFGEQSPLPSNIRNGFGIFVARNVLRHTYDM